MSILTLIKKYAHLGTFRYIYIGTSCGNKCKILFSKFPTLLLSNSVLIML